MDYIKVVKKGFGFTKSDRYFKINGQEELLRFAMQIGLPVWTSDKGRIVLEACIVKTNKEDFLIGINSDDLKDLIHINIKPLLSFNIVKELDRGDLEILEVKPLSPEEAENYKNLAFKVRKEKSSREFRAWSSKWHFVNNYNYCFGRDTVMEKVIYEDINNLNNKNYTSVFLYRGVEASSEKELAEMFHIKKYGCTSHDHTQDMADSYDLLSD